MSPTTRESSRAEDRVVVIGSGPSGAMAAHVLVRAGIPVTMLECGLRPPRGLIVRAAGNTVVRWRAQGDLITGRHVSVGDPATEWYSTLAPGGLSNYWTAAVPRYAPDDFADGARLDRRFEWPVGYDDLAPHYALAEQLLSISGPGTSIPQIPAGQVRYELTMPNDWAQLAEPRPPELSVLPLARGARWMVALRGSEFNSFHVIVDPLSSSRSFELRLGSRATRLRAGSDGAITGVEYVDQQTRSESFIAARAVVLAAGTIDTTRILLSSTSPAWPRGVGNHGGLVGRYLHDHPKEWWPVRFERPMTVVGHPLYLARQPHVETAPLSGASATIGLATYRERLKSFIGGKSRMFGVQVFGMMVPCADHEMRLSPTRVDEWGQPAIELDIRYDQHAVGTLAAMRTRFTEWFGDAGLPATIEPVDWIPRPGSSVHFAGTARMHADPDHGVVDEWSRVRGAENVIVADMSVFTTSPEKNPTLTAMALAGRAADRLARS